MLTRRDRSIIRELRSDARQRLVDISRKTGIPTSTVHERIRNLVSSGEIRLVSLPDYRALSVPLEVWFFIKVKERDAVIDKLLNHPSTNTLLKAGNGVDIIAECIFKDFRQYHDFSEELEQMAKVVSHPVVEVMERESAIIS